MSRWAGAAGAGGWQQGPGVDTSSNKGWAAAGAWGTSAAAATGRIQQWSQPPQQDTGGWGASHPPQGHLMLQRQTAFRPMCCSQPPPPEAAAAVYLLMFLYPCLTQRPSLPACLLPCPPTCRRPPAFPPAPPPPPARPTAQHDGAQLPPGGARDQVDEADQVRGGKGRGGEGNGGKGGGYKRRQWQQVQGGGAGARQHCNGSNYGGHSSCGDGTGGGGHNSRGTEEPVSSCKEAGHASIPRQRSCSSLQQHSCHILGWAASLHTPPTPLLNKLATC